MLSVGLRATVAEKLFTVASGRCAVPSLRQPVLDPCAHADVVIDDEHPPFIGKHRLESSRGQKSGPWSPNSGRWKHEHPRNFAHATYHRRRALSDPDCRRRRRHPGRSPARPRIRRLRGLLAEMRKTMPEAHGDLGQRMGLGLERFPTSCGAAWGHSGSFPGYWTHAWSSANGIRICQASL